MHRVDEDEVNVYLTTDTENATEIHPSDAPDGDREKYQKFRAYNTGMWNGPRRENTEQFRRQDNLHTYDAIAGQMQLTDHQKRRGRHLLDDLHVKSFGKPIEHVAFGVCVVVTNADVRGENKRYWPHPQAKNNDRLFENVASNLDIPLGEQLSVISQVKSFMEM